MIVTVIKKKWFVLLVTMIIYVNVVKSMFYGEDVKFLLHECLKIIQH